MRKNKSGIINFLKGNGGVARFSAIIKAGFHPDSLIALEKEKRIEKVARGLYKLTDYDFDSYPDLVTASLQAPKGVICLISALAFYEVTDEIPRHVDIAIPRGSHANIIKYPPVKFYHFEIKSWESGIEERNIEGHKVKIYNLPKTIADCFKFRNKIGMNIARDALKAAVTEKGVKAGDVMRYAKICRVSNIIKPILEAIL